MKTKQKKSMDTETHKKNLDLKKKSKLYFFFFLKTKRKKERNSGPLFLSVRVNILQTFRQRHKRRICKQAAKKKKKNLERRSRTENIGVYDFSVIKNTEEENVFM